MISFVCRALGEIIHRLMGMILRSTIAAEANTAYELVCIHLNDKENQLPRELIKLSTTTKSLLSSSVASDTSKPRFKADCGSMIKSLVLKLQERLLIKYIFVRSLVSLTPDCGIKNKEFAMIKFSKL